MRNQSDSRISQTRLLTAAVCLLWAASTVQAELPEGLGAYYRFNSTSGLTAIDETGAHNGTLTGALNWVAGVEGNALQFKGGNGSPFVNTGAWQTTGTEGLSVALWAKWAGANSLYQGLVSHRDGTMYWWIEIPGDGGQLRFKSNTSPQSILLAGTPHLVKDEWVHVAFSHDAADKRGVAYLNGVEKVAGAWSLPAGVFSNYRAGIGVVNCADGLGTFNGILDEVMIFQRPVAATEVQDAMDGFDEPVATQPSPADGRSDVPTDVALGWASNGVSPTHDVYLGTGVEDLAPVAQGLAETTWQPAEPLEYGTTYFWRIDEVNGAPDNTVFPGDLWSFTTEPFSYPIAGVIATASSYAAGMGPEKVVDGSGLTGDLHSNDNMHMWLTSPTGSQPAWIQFQFDKVYKVDQMWAWNSNQGVEVFVGFGAKDVTVEYSIDGVAWTTLADVPGFAQAPGAEDYDHNTTVDFGGVEAQYVKLTINSNWGMLKQYGLSEVRFLYIPVQARQPEPATGAIGVSLDTDLSWRPGREATSHTVYFGADSEAVTQGTAPADTVTDHSFAPSSMEFGTTYYWRVDEVGDAGTYAGDVWSLTSQEFATIDDFEAYNDDDNRIYNAWVDGVTTQASGSQVGYDESPFAEKTIVHGGAQSMPLMYDNTGSPYYSEAEFEFGASKNLTVSGAQNLRLFYRGVAPSFVQTASGSILMNGIGADIWGTADQFRFAYKSLSGNGSIVARVNSLFNSNTWAKAGVMIRQSTELGSVHAFMAKTAVDGNGASFQRRLVAGGSSSNNDAPTAMLAPYWVKIDRTGDKFTAYTSPDGVAWTQLGEAQTIPMTGAVLIGLAVCSHDAAVVTSAEFSDIQTTGEVTGDWQIAAIGAEQPEGNSPEPIYLTVKDSSGKSKTVVHPDPAATGRTGWQQWQIPLSEFTSAGVKMTAVDSIVIGVGNRTSPTAGGTGILYIDDVGYGRAAGQ